MIFSSHSKGEMSHFSSPFALIARLPNTGNELCSLLTGAMEAWQGCLFPGRQTSLVRTNAWGKGRETFWKLPCILWLSGSEHPLGNTCGHGWNSRSNLTLPQAKQCVKAGGVPSSLGEGSQYILLCKSLFPLYSTDGRAGLHARGDQSTCGRRCLGSGGLSLLSNHDKTLQVYSVHTCC